VRPRVSSIAFPLAAWAVFVLAAGWPTVALLVRCITQGAVPREGLTFTARQTALLWRTLWLSATATVLCLALSLPAAYVLGRARSPARRPLLSALLMTLLLTPPMVYAFGWLRILPADFNPYARCIGVWALWAWPIPALFLGAGWSRAARTAHEAATLVVSPWTAFLRVALPILSRYIALGALIVFVLFFGDYGVPHACNLTVYATDILGWAQESSRTIDVLAPALPGVVVVGAAVWLILWMGSRIPADGDDESGSSPEPSTVRASGDRHATVWHRLLAGSRAVWHRLPAGERRSMAALWATIALLTVSWLLPIGWLTVKLGSPGAFAQAIRTYAADLGWSIGVAAVSGLVVVGMGVGLCASPRGGRFALGWTVMLGALPGGLIGVALIGAYNNSVTYPIYDAWPIVAISYAARFGWIGVLIGLLVTGRRASPLAAQARTDGADDGAVLTRVQLPMHFATLLAGVAVVTALALADVAASSLVRVPSYNPIAHVLIEKYHRFEDGMLVSLSLWLTAAVVPAAVLLAWMMRRRGR